MGTPASLLDLISRGGSMQVGFDQRKDKALTLAALANAKQSEAAAKSQEVEARANEQKIKLQEQAMRDQQAITEAYRTTGGDPVQMREFLRPRLSGMGVQSWEKHELDLRTAAQKLKGAELEVEQKNNAKAAQLLLAVGQSPDPVAAYASIFPQLPKGVPPPEQFSKETLPLIIGGLGHYDAVLKDAKERADLKQTEQTIATKADEETRNQRAAFLQSIRPDMTAEEFAAAREAFPKAAKQFPSAPGQWMARAAQEGIAIKDRSKAEMDARILAGTSPTGITAEQQAKMDADQIREAEQLRHNKATEGLTARGQNMTDARGREMAEITRDNKPPSSSEQRAAGFWNRATEAEKNLTALEPSIEKMGLVDRARMKYGPNIIQTDEAQSYIQSQRAFIESVLRKDSGANIPPHEYDSLSKTYFPQPGDSKAVLEQKRASRLTQLKSLKAEAGRGVKAYGEEYSPDGTPPKPSSSSAKIQVRDPSGGIHDFDTQAQADDFKRLAGIK